jgi:hypothetical protein
MPAAYSNGSVRLVGYAFVAGGVLLSALAVSLYLHTSVGSGQSLVIGAFAILFWGLIVWTDAFRKSEAARRTLLNTLLIDLAVTGTIIGVAIAYRFTQLPLEYDVEVGLVWLVVVATSVISVSALSWALIVLTVMLLHPHLEFAECGMDRLSEPKDSESENPYQPPRC